MSTSATQRLVPIRPSPAKVLLSSSTKNITLNISTTVSPSTLTPPRTGTKRKLEDPANDSVKCKRKINFGMNNYIVSPQPAAVARRNARERNRVKQVNNGFATLRQHIPGAAKAKKISKVETLKQAVEYIRSLQDLLDDNDALVAQSNYESQANSILPHDVSYVDSISTETQPSIPYSTYYNRENLSPLTGIYTQSLSTNTHSPASSVGTTSSPSPSYSSETPILAHDSNTLIQVDGFTATGFFADTYGGNFDLYDAVPTLEEEEVLDVIASWQDRQ